MRALWLPSRLLAATIALSAASLGCPAAPAPPSTTPDDDPDEPAPLLPPPGRGTLDPLRPPPPPPPPTPDACVDEAPWPSRAPMRLMTRFEYDNTVRDLVGDQSRPADENFPPENGTLGFDNNADVHTASPVLVQRYMEVAEAIAERAVAQQWPLLVPCDPAVVGETICGQDFLRSFLTRAFRRPPLGGEVAVFSDLLTTWGTAGGFELGVQTAIEAVLQSPQFLYRVEEAPAAATEEPIAITGYAMASRLSYLLWASMPDAQLFEAAESGALDTSEGIAMQARRLLADVRARDSVRHFHEQWLGLEALDHIVKDSTTYPVFGDAMRADWREEINRFVEHVIFEGDGTYGALMTSPVTFVNSNLAAFYAVDGPAHDGFEQVTLDATQRAGLLTQPGMMAILAGTDQSSPVLRGVFVRDRMLCDPLPPPPADVEITPPDPDPNATTRERFAQHTEDEFCATCHVLIDPIGFGFEKYDGVGRFRTQENNLTIDASGELTQVDPQTDGPFDGAVELAQRLGSSEVAMDCYALQWFRYMSGRAESYEDVCSVTSARAAMREAGGSVEELIVALVTSDAFRFRNASDVNPPEELP